MLLSLRTQYNELLQNYENNQMELIQVRDTYRNSKSGVYQMMEQLEMQEMDVKNENQILKEEIEDRNEEIE